MKQKTTVLQPLFMCVLLVFLLCFVVVNVAAADDVFITNVANEMKEEGGKALEANKDFSNNVNEAITALDASVKAIEAAESDVSKIQEAEGAEGEIKKKIGELKEQTKNAYDRSLILRESGAIFLENGTIEVFEEQINKIKQNVALVKKAMSAMSENNDINARKALDDAEKLTESVNDIWLYVKQSVDVQTKAAENALFATENANNNFNDFVEKQKTGAAKTLVTKLNEQFNKNLAAALETLMKIQTASATVGEHVDGAIEKFKAVVRGIEELKNEFEIKQRRQRQEEEERTTSNITNTRDIKEQLEDLITADGGVIVFSSFAVIILQILTTAVV